MTKSSNNVVFMGNWQYRDWQSGRGYAGATFDPRGIANTLTTMQGGNREPMIIVRKR